MPKALNILLLLMYCHFAVAGFPGAYLMKKMAQVENHSLADASPADAEDGGDDDGGQDDSGKTSPSDPDQCHRCTWELPDAKRTEPEHRPNPFTRTTALPVLVPDIPTPPPEW